MDNLYLVLMSFIQGLTEFLPVSSSGHLILLPYVLGQEHQGLAFDVALHLGTLIAVCAYFYKKLIAMTIDTLVYAIKGFKKQNLTENVQTVFYLGLATVPAVIIGFLGGGFISTIFRHPFTVVFTSGIFALVMWRADKSPITPGGISFRHALFIGLGQSIALIPGVSRSGICLTVARFMGLDRVKATEFTFLLSIPVIAGAVILNILKPVEGEKFISFTDPFMVKGILFSCCFGFLAIHFMLAYLKRYSLNIFVVYRLILSIGSGLFLYFH